MCTLFIQMMMERYGLLTNVEAFNLVLEGYGRTGDLGAVFTCYHDMSVAEIPANLDTYHIMIDCVLRDAAHRSSKVRNNLLYTPFCYCHDVYICCSCRLLFTGPGGCFLKRYLRYSQMSLCSTSSFVVAEFAQNMIVHSTSSLCWNPLLSHLTSLPFKSS